jgi:hypothetical protein
MPDHRSGLPGHDVTTNLIVAKLRDSYPCVMATKAEGMGIRKSTGYGFTFRRDDYYGCAIDKEDVHAGFGCVPPQLRSASSAGMQGSFEARRRHAMRS